jgi:hypothetical protein
MSMARDLLRTQRRWGSHAAHEPVNEGFGVSSSPPPIATRPAVEEVGGGDGAAGDVEAALLSGHGRVSQVVVGH